MEKITLICDTREQRNMSILSAFNEKGIPWTARKLEYGDYSFEIDGISYENKCVVERKQNLVELAGNLTKDRIRFETELAKAKADGCKIALLVEDKKAKEKMKLRIEMDKANEDMDVRFRKTWRTRFTGNGMVGSIKALKERYDLELIFCHKLATAGEILRVFEEYLENNK
jgi:hypothetical protein